MDIATISKLIDAGFTAQEIRTFASADTGAGAITTAPAATPAGAAPNLENAGTGNSARTCTSAAACSGAEAAELAKMLKQMQENLQKQPEPNQAAQNPDGQTMRDLLGAIRNLNTTIQAGAILNSNMPPLKSDADIAAGGLANILNPFADRQNGGN